MQVQIPKRLRCELAPRNAETPWLTGRGTRWQVIDDWWVQVGERWYCVPAGYVFDGSSIPWWLWWLFPPTYAPAFEASCWHDICYSHWYQEVHKWQADDGFKAIMLYNGASRPVAWGFHKAVSLFGRGGW